MLPLVLAGALSALAIEASSGGRVIHYCLVAVSLLALTGKGQPQHRHSTLGIEKMASRQWRMRYPYWARPSQSAPAWNNPNNKMALSSSAKWPNRVVFFAVDNSLGQFRSVIRRAMREIEARTCIRFRQRQNERDYVNLVNGKGCHSKVGRAGGRQVLSLGVGCHDVGSTLHELCHAIGLYHEHMRWDRDQYLNIIWPNILPSMYDQFQKVPVNQYRPATNFDYNSIMIYGSKAFSKNGLNTMVPRDSRARISESHFKERLSQSDVININSLYGCTQ